MVDVRRKVVLMNLIVEASDTGEIVLISGITTKTRDIFTLSYHAILKTLVTLAGKEMLCAK